MSVDQHGAPSHSRPVSDHGLVTTACSTLLWGMDTPRLGGHQGVSAVSI
jgi:hypothetical protein